MLVPNAPSHNVGTDSQPCIPELHLNDSTRETHFSHFPCCVGTATHARHTQAAPQWQHHKNTMYIFHSVSMHTASVLHKCIVRCTRTIIVTPSATHTRTTEPCDLKPNLFGNLICVPPAWLHRDCWQLHRSFLQNRAAINALVVIQCWIL